MNAPLIGYGEVRHARLRPVAHAFAYPTLFVLLPMRSWRHASWALARNRRALFSFRDSDHGEGGADALQWLDDLLASEGIADADGEAWLHCFPRVFGHAFKPVSFWYCHRADGSLRAIVAEVHNTFGERHAYVLDDAAWGRELRAEKRFHVSPFCEVTGHYRFRFLTTPSRERTVVRIDYDDGQGALLQTSVSGRLQPLTASAIRVALLRFPFLGLAIVWRIHWHALRLWLRKVPFIHQPAGPVQRASRGGPA
ncbi:DUF1365 domain-containing protein [Ramlibacter sp.]|uniref:DUF1365 domain-containing protein n=1 Tax=Ramlibacter sp. TaxID=1917967 RepID=UPI003D0BA7FA